MPVDNGPDKAEQGTPLSGQIFETHPEARVASEAKCHLRGFHLTDVHQPAPWACVDCGSDGSDRILWRDVNKQPPPMEVHDIVPETLTHNPDANFAERMRERGLTPEERRERDKNKPSPAPTTEVHVTREQAKVLAKAYGLHLVDPEGESGVSQHMSEQLARLQEENAVLKKAAQSGPAQAEAAPVVAGCAWCGKPSASIICADCAAKQAPSEVK